MADFGIFTKNSSIAARAGVNVNSTSVSIAETDKYVLQVEAEINCEQLFNWSDAYAAGLDADVQGILEGLGSDKCAMKVINSDMSGMSLLEAQTRLDVLRDSADRAQKLLKDDNVRKFIEGV